MSSSGRHPLRFVVAGAASLLGKEVVELLQSGVLPAHEVRLLDDAALAGTLTGAGDEAAFIQAVEADSFEDATLVFFAGAPEFTSRHWAATERAGAAVIDLSGALAEVRGAVPLIPSLDAVLGAPQDSRERLYRSPNAAVIVAATLAGALRAFALRRLAITFLQPVSERGQAGIQELESQTVSLLSFQPFAREVFDAQVAFNLLSHYGEESLVRLEDSREQIARDVAGYLGGRAPAPAIQLIQAPVFYGCGFSAFAEFEKEIGGAAVQAALGQAGAAEARESPSTADAAGSAAIYYSFAPDPNVSGGHWLWGAVDNVRLAAQNAVRIAEKLLATHLQ
jgi:aspartate-semialdehyde dehydrogenase